MLQVGDMSLFQVIRGGLLLTLLPIVVYTLATVPRPERISAAGVLAFPIVILGTWYVRLSANGNFNAEDLVSSLQVVYWSCWLVLLFSRSHRPTTWRYAVRGLLAGGTIIAVSVFAAFLVNPDTASIYRQQGVEASWGWFLTTKGLTGQLLVCTVIGAYVAAAGRGRFGYIIAAMTTLACYLTYQRSGAVAMVACLLCLWYARWRAEGFRTAVFTGVAALGLLMAVAVYSIPQAVLENLSTRWADVLDPRQWEIGRAGSGRVIFIPAALSAYWNSPLFDQAIGFGYAGMLNTMEQAHGLRIHTHTDVVDALLVAGPAGLASYLTLLIVVWRRTRDLLAGRPELLYARAVAVVYVAHALLTGHIWLPDVMFWYALGLAALVGIGRRGPHRVSRGARP